MRIVLFCCVLLNTCISQSWGKDILLYVYSDQSVKRPYLFELEKEMHNMDVDMISYPIDVRRTVDEHVLRIDSIFRDYREKTDSLGIFMLADEEASFVALDVLSKDTAIIALFAMSGVFCNGDDYFYNEVSIKKNLMMLDSVSFDNKKERHLRMVYKMISYAKQGKTFKIPKGADEQMCNLFNLLNSRYGRSLLEFSLDDHLKRIRSWIIPFYRNKNQSSELELYIGKLLYVGALYGVKYTEPQSYNEEYVSSEIVKHVSNLLIH